MILSKLILSNNLLLLFGIMQFMVMYNLIYCIVCITFNSIIWYKLYSSRSYLLFQYNINSNLNIRFNIYYKIFR